MPANKPKASAELTPEAFVRRYRDAIRVGFNWDRFFAENWPIEIVTLNSRAQLSHCYMPWYVGKTGDEVAYDHPEAKPMRLTDVPKVMGILNDERQEDIRQYAQEFTDETHVIEFAAPTFGLPDDEFFILDRNHRFSALTLVQAPFQVTLWNVCGPDEPDALLDLIHWHPEKA